MLHLLFILETGTTRERRTIIMKNKLLDWEQENYDKLRAALGIDVTEKEDRTLRWLAGWDHTTIENLVSIFQRTRGRD